MWNGHSSNAFVGWVQRFELRDGIDGPIVAEWDGREGHPQRATLDLQRREQHLGARRVGLD